MVCTCFDFALQELARLEVAQRLTTSMKVQLYNLQLELKFLKMFIWCYDKSDYTGNKDVCLGSFMADMEVTLQEIAGQWEKWDISASRLLEKFEHLKSEMKKVCLDLLHSPLLSWKSSTSDEIYDFIVSIYQNLEDLGSSKGHKIVPVKEQMELLQEKLALFGLLVKFTAERCISHDEELRDFRVQVQAWACRVAILSFLYWVDQVEEETVPKWNTIFLDALQETKSCTREVIRISLGVLKASRSSRSDKFLTGVLVASSVDLLLEDLMASTEDSIKMSIRDGLIILITFLMDPPMECGKDGNEILAKADIVLDEAVSIISSLYVREEKECIPKGIDFLRKIDVLKAEIREHHVQIQDLSWSNFPKTNGLGFIDFLLENLKERASSIVFAKCLILAMQEKLRSLRPYLRDLMELPDERKDLKDLWTRIINLVYAVEHVTNSCFFEDDPVWYKMICLSIFIEEIEFIMPEVEKIRDESLNNKGVLRVEMNFSCAIPKHAKTSRIDEAVVGFKKEAEAIIDQLTRGSEELEIVSIVGMPGQGKTTLANKVYNDPSVKYHFNKLAWCFLSQEYQWKGLLLTILSDIVVLDDKIHELGEEELAEKLYRCLKGQRYLIVMDDIWDIKAWHQLKESFPNDNNGSRIMFTSRIHSVGSQAKLSSSTHLLCPLSIEESWDLLQKKLFHEDGCPPSLTEVGRQIVEICKGLPLSVVVIAGVLARRVTDLNWWKEIATNLRSHILVEGCMSILELSYKHLPDILKPCFLYFGAFQQGKAIKVQKLTQLWVAEGFIPKSGTERLEDVAKDFLMDLIGRSLIIVVKRSSDAGIKECRVHDLLFDLCLAKVKEERFLRSLDYSQYPSNMKYEQYRLSIHTEWRPFVESNPTALYARTLLFLQHTQWNDHPNDPSFLLKFKFVRVLDLEYGVSFRGFPEEIISLIHLRYLAIRWISVLPSSIEYLQNLEVLRVHSSSTEILAVPDTIWKMKRLRHVCLRRATYFYFGNYVLEAAQLENVDTLSWPLLCRNEYGQELLRRFPKVRKLRFRLWDHQTNCLQFPVLDFLSNLESVNVLCPMGMHHPCDFRFPSALKKLTLSESRLPWSEISAIGKLRNLEVLKLLADAFVGGWWDMEDDKFLNLKFLKLEWLNIQQWNACPDPFPRLQRLVLEDCHELEEIPSSFGEISTLNQIEVHSCSSGAETSARNILNEQLELGNDGLRVLITKSSSFFDDEE